ncbi:Transmembrane and coiled-coil domain-containing protein 4 [Branchiostoma belcheri]|nr:Transmembrane and coiled-coil domain-containing protein 4 [Branchiostoma belcheri]
MAEPADPPDEKTEESSSFEDIQERKINNGIDNNLEPASQPTETTNNSVRNNDMTTETNNDDQRDIVLATSHFSIDESSSEDATKNAVPSETVQTKNMESTLSQPQLVEKSTATDISGMEDSKIEPENDQQLSRTVGDTDSDDTTEDNRQVIERPSHLDVEPIVKKISDAAHFSYAALCAISMAQLFDTQYDRQWKKNFLLSLREYLELPESVEASMEAFQHGMGSECLPSLVDTLVKEPYLETSAFPLVQDLLTFGLREGDYDARTRCLLKQVALYLRVPWEEVETYEESLVKSLKEHQFELSEEERKERERQKKRKQRKRFVTIGLATVVGGTLIGLTGGLAAPLVAAGAGAIIGGTSAAVLGSTAGLAVITSLFGAAGAGLTGYKMKKRVGAVEQFEFEPLTEGNQLHITIAVSGWLRSDKPDNFSAPWETLLQSKEQYCLRWEAKYLLSLGRAFEYIVSSLVTTAAQEALKYTVLAGLLAALTWPVSLMSAAYVIDNPWSVCLQRSEEVGKQLAEGKRPVTLVGFSLGARVIFYCLKEMAKRKDCEGIIEDVVLLGAPINGKPENWMPMDRLVSGRIINGYCRGDWLLQFLYRTSSVQLSVAGLRPVKWDNRRMLNVDLSSVVNGHMDYMNQMDTILKAVGVKTKECRVADKWDLATIALDSSKRHGVTGLRRSATAPELAELQDKPQQGVTKSRTEFLIVERAELGAREANDSNDFHKKNEDVSKEEETTVEEVESALEATELEENVGGGTESQEATDENVEGVCLPMQSQSDDVESMSKAKEESATVQKAQEGD